MATTPVPTPQLLSSPHPISVYLKTHERLVLVLVLACLSWFTFGKIENVISAHDHASLEQAKVVAAVQQEKNEALAKQMAQHDADVEALAAKVEARDAQS
jgi:cell division protein FtsB